MTLLFTIEQNITLDKIFFKDDTEYDSDATVTKYVITYKPYLAEDGDTEYTYEITDLASLSMIKTGMYISPSDFNDGSGDATMADGAYTFDIEAIYNTTTTLNLSLLLTYVGQFYQGVYNTYGQIHLNYDWTQRYKEDTRYILQLAEELTWIDSLKLASENQNRPEEFISILTNLQRYFTFTYDY